MNKRGQIVVEYLAVRWYVRHDDWTATGHRFNYDVRTAFKSAERNKRIRAFHQSPKVRYVSGEHNPLSKPEFANQTLKIGTSWTIAANKRLERHVRGNLGQRENQVLHVLA